MTTDMISLSTSSAEETASLGEHIGRAASQGLFIALSGDLGTGKTAMTKGIARGLGITEIVTSPTFQLVKEYDGRLRLFHFDFYRLSSAGDVVDLDIAGCLETGVVVAEWSNMFDEFATGDFIEIYLEWIGEFSRRITIKNSGGSGTSLLENVNESLKRFVENE